MKKVLTFVLALVMVLALAAPALAFTGKDKDESTDPYKISIQLVDYYSASFTKGYYTNLPAADRGYLYNEMVGAVVSMYIPADAETAKMALKVTSENVKVWDILAEDDKAINVLGIVPGRDASVMSILKDDKEATIHTVGFVDGSKGDDKTYRYLVLGQLTGEAGSITAAVKDNSDSKKLPVAPETPVTIKEFQVYKDNATTYCINKDGMFLKIKVDSNNYCKEMTIISTKDKVLGYADAFNTFKVEVLNGAIAYIDTNGKIVENVAGLREQYAALNSFYNKVKDAFGIDRATSGYLYDSFFYGIKGSKGVSATAYLEPYVASITVPDVVVDPPKTGDASTLVGIVMVIAALAGVVVMKKVRA